MRLDQIGEFGLIDKIKSMTKTFGSVIQGIGDDCAVVEYTLDKYLLLTCDMIVEGVDFTLKDKPHLIGRKALGVSLSDIASCGGKPLYALVSLGIPKNASVKLAEGIYRGMRDLAAEFKVNIVGGDISSAEKIVIDVSLIGEVEKKKLVLRSGAQKSDIIMVSGRLGGSIQGKHLRFIPRVNEARFLTDNFKINSMIDISDGLSQDLWHILDASQTGAIVYQELVPLSKQARDIKDALCSGEDFELLFTLSADEARKLFKKTDKFIPIGHIIDKRFGFILMDKNGKKMNIAPGGFRHF